MLIGVWLCIRDRRLRAKVSVTAYSNWFFEQRPQFTEKRRLPQVRGAVADLQARKAEERASLGISSSGIERTHLEIPGVGLTPLLMEVE